MVAVSVEAFPEFNPTPRVGITITDLTVGASVVSVWRIADGAREPVRGARRADMSDSDYVIDYDVPLGRPVSYEVEVVSGPQRLSRVTSSSVTVSSVDGCIMDPLIPESSVRITRRHLPTGEATFAVSALASLEYAADVSVFNIMGSNKPLALFGQRLAAAGVDFSMITDAAEENERMRRLLQSSAQLLVRVPASWTTALPGSCFAVFAKVSESPLGAPYGDPLTVWELSGDTVAAPTIKVLTATFTYGDVAILFETYGQKQDLMAGKTYLDDLKNPIGG
jgi:hypothetical protein